jgi:hypothetical protein
MNIWKLCILNRPRDGRFGSRISVGARDISSKRPDHQWGHPAACSMGIGCSFPVGCSDKDMMITTHIQRELPLRISGAIDIILLFKARTGTSLPFTYKLIQEHQCVLES